MTTKKRSFYQLLFSWMFGLTGIFAFVSSMYTWGKGFLFTHEDLDLVLIPMADLFITFPLSLLAAYGVWRGTRWGRDIAMVTAGIYVFGSVLVYISLFFGGPPYSIPLLVIPLFGLGISIGYFIWVQQHKSSSSSRNS